MQGIRLKFSEHQNEWRCFLCCHVRTGTVFIGVWNLMLHVIALPIMAIVMSYPKEDLDAAMPTSLSNEKDNFNFEMPGSKFEVLFNNKSKKSSPLLRSYKDLWEYKTYNIQDTNVGVVITFCTFAMTLLLLYGAVKGKPSYLMPFFCLQVFNFCIASITAIGYLCYFPDINKFLLQNNRIPLNNELMGLHPQTLGLFAVFIFLLIMSIKAYFIGVVWSCYKYLTLRQVAAQRTVQFIDPDVQNLLPDLPDYETAVKKIPTPPPSYAAVVMGQVPVVIDTNSGSHNSINNNNNNNNNSNNNNNNDCLQSLRP